MSHERRKQKQINHEKSFIALDVFFFILTVSLMPIISTFSMESTIKRLSLAFPIKIYSNYQKYI